MSTYQPESVKDFHGAYPNQTACNAPQLKWILNPDTNTANNECVKSKETIVLITNKDGTYESSDQ